MRENESKADERSKGKKVKKEEMNGVERAKR